MMSAYRIETSPDDNGTVLITCPAFPELTTYSEPGQEAVRALAALEEAMAARISGGDRIPRPDAKGLGGVKLPLLTALKGELYRTMQKAGVTRAELARRLGWHREQVDRLFRLNHTSRIDQIEAAFRALNRDIDLRVREIA
jgi:antitoxin HicB